MVMPIMLAFDVDAGYWYIRSTCLVLMRAKLTDIAGLDADVDADV